MYRDAQKALFERHGIMVTSTYAPHSAVDLLTHLLIEMKKQRVVLENIHSTLRRLETK